MAKEFFCNFITQEQRQVLIVKSIPAFRIFPCLRDESFSLTPAVVYGRLSFAERNFWRVELSAPSNLISIKLYKTHKVKSLYAFGSVLSDNFNRESDIDLIVDFSNCSARCPFAVRDLHVTFSLGDYLSLFLLKQKLIKMLCADLFSTYPTPAKCHSLYLQYFQARQIS